MRPGKAYDVAIVGMGCRFPGAPDLFTYWANCLANRDQTREVPADRWPLAQFHDPAPRSNDRLACRRGGYLDTPIDFDSAALGVMPLAVTGGEPEQFLVLDAARAALDDAGIDPRQLDRWRVQVVIGRGNYFNRGNLLRLQHGRIAAQTVGLLAAIHPEWTADDLERIRQDLKSSLPPFEAATIPGQLTNATAGRLAHQFDLSGASFVVDAASASALVALDLGSRALIERRADLVLVGGVYLEADVDFPLVFRQLNLLSPSGRARPFCADADGMVCGEGVGVVVLRRLRDAERAGDRVYAVLKGVGLASDGKAQGLTAPSAKGHARAMRRAYRMAGIRPETVGLIEAHGLGVPAADRAELRALKHVFPRPEGNPRALSAGASQIGHAMPAAGMSALIRAALALHHRTLPPANTGQNPDPRVAAGGFELIASARPWIHGDSQAPRRAGVNAFGFAGASAHAVLEEHPASADGMTPGALLEWDSEAILLAASGPLELAERVRSLRERLARNHRVSLKDLAFTVNSELTEQERNQEARLGIVAASRDELDRHLAAIEARLRDSTCRQVRDARGLYFWAEPLGREAGRLAFLFPGEGSQYPGMLADLCPHFPELRAVLDTADRIAFESGEAVPPSAHLFGGGTSRSQALWATDTAVTAVLSSQWGMFQVLRQLGLRPDAVCGHSSGELPAIAAAGALETERTLERQLSRLAAIFRGLEAQGAIPSARLIASGTDRQKAESVCRMVGGSVVVAIDNCPHQVVLAGPSAQVDQVLDRLRSQGVICEDLPFSRAYHTPGFAAVLNPLADFYAELELHQALVPIYSCASADRIPNSPDAIRRLALEQWTRPVAFRDTVEAMYRDGLRIFVDVGARGNLCGYVEDILRGRPSYAVAANLPKRSGTAQLNHLVASLFAQGLPVDPGYLHARRRPRRVDLDSPATTISTPVRIEVGFPEMKLSETTIARLRGRSGPEARNGDASHHGNGSAASRSAAQLFSPVVQTLTTDRDQAMMDYLERMNDFLNTQCEVMEAYLGTPRSTDSETDLEQGHLDPNHIVEVHHDGPEPGPWVGTIKELEPGRRIVAIRSLDPSGDPIADNHTLGGRRVSALAPERKGLPVLAFSVMAEMVAQAGALLVPPGLVLESLRDVHAHRWVPFDRDGRLEIRGERDPANLNRVRVALRHLEGCTDSEGRLVFEGTACFAERPPAPAAATPLVLEDARPSKFTAERLYEEQWLFHGPPMRALTEVGPVSPDGLSGTITVLPLDDLLRPEEPDRFQSDPIALDTFTHLLGCWGLDCLSQGDVIFPLRMGSMTQFGTPPPVGTPVECRIHVREVQRRFVRVDADLVRPDGLVWMRIRDWQDWRFYWPARYRDVFRAPDSILLGEELPLGEERKRDAVAVWLAPPGDMGRPVWRDVLEQIQLAPEERAEMLNAVTTDRNRAHFLWGRIAAKEAVRRLWLADGESARFPADLLIDHDPSGQPRFRDLAQPERSDCPRVSIAHAEGVVAAVAARTPSARVGIDVEPIRDRPEPITALFTHPAERSVLSTCGAQRRAEAVARLGAAKQAAAKAAGLGPRAGPGETQVRSLDLVTGTAVVVLSQGVEFNGPIRVHTEQREDFVWAWTLGEAIEDT